MTSTRHWTTSCDSSVADVEHPTCNICERSLELRWAPVLVGVSGPVRAEVERAPYRACPDEHYRVELRRGFVDEVIDHAVAELPVADRRLLRRTDRCGACGEALTMPARATARSVTLVLPELPPLTITFELPMTRCPACGVQQVPAGAADHLEPALEAALIQRGLGPAGPRSRG